MPLLELFEGVFRVPCAINSWAMSLDGARRGEGVEIPEYHARDALIQKSLQ